MGAAAFLSKARRLGMRQWTDLAWATCELALARRKLSYRVVAKFLPSTAGGLPQPDLSPAQERVAERVAFAIPRAGARVPWRSDCLVQAMAARRWLERCRVGSELHVGVRRGSERKLDAHAWLTCGNKVVTGGDISNYAPLAKPEVLTALCEGAPGPNSAG